MLIVEKGRIHLNGVEFVPIATYHIGSGVAYKAQRLTDLSAIVNLGYNTVITRIGKDDATFLGQAKDYRIKIIAELNDDADVLAPLLNRYPNVIGIIALDDVDNPESNYSIDFVRNCCKLCKQRFPGKLTYLSGGYPQRIVRYFGLSDIISLQSYVVGAEPLYAVCHAYLPQPSIAAAGFPAMALLSCLQTFAWPGKTYPSNFELCNMQAQAMAWNVAGIVHYAYTDGAYDCLKSHPDSFDAFRKMVVWIKRYYNLE